MTTTMHPAAKPTTTTTDVSSSSAATAVPSTTPKLKHKKFKGDYRRVRLSADNFQISFSKDSGLRTRFRDHVKGATWKSERDEIGWGVGGYYLLPFTKENAVILLKFGIENDFRFSHEVLIKVNELVRSKAA